MNILFFIFCVLLVLNVYGGFLSVKEERSFHQKLINELSLIRKSIDEKDDKNV